MAIGVPVQVGLGTLGCGKENPGRVPQCVGKPLFLRWFSGLGPLGTHAPEVLRP